MRFRRYRVVTTLLVAYALFMTLYFGLDLLREGQVFRFAITLAAEAVVITAAFFALRKRDRTREGRRGK